MEGWSLQGMVIFLGSVAVATSMVFLFYKFKRITLNPKKKSEADRLLLKQLLEGFGLEVPSELNENETGVIKSIKAP